MTTPLNTQNEEAGDSHLPQRNVAGAVLRATRLSAGLQPEQLAAAAGVNEQKIHSWESGHEPLDSVPVTQMEVLKDALGAAGAPGELIADLDTATWCDVVSSAITEHDDLRCLLADPLASEPAFGELLAWALTGHEPSRYHPLLSAGRDT